MLILKLIAPGAAERLLSEVAKRCTTWSCLLHMPDFSILAPAVKNFLRIPFPTTWIPLPSLCHSNGTEVLFTSTHTGGRVAGEQFWGRAVRAPRNSKGFRGVLNSRENSDLPTLHSVGISR